MTFDANLSDFTISSLIALEAITNITIGNDTDNDGILQLVDLLYGQDVKFGDILIYLFHAIQIHQHRHH